MAMDCFSESLGIVFMENLDKVFGGSLGWKGDLESGAGGGMGQPLGNGFGRVGSDLVAACGAASRCKFGEQESQVVGRFGGGADGGSGPRRETAGANGDGGGDSIDPFGVGFVEVLEELAGAGRQAFNVPALSFGVEGVEREGRLPAAADAADGEPLPVGYVEVNVLQVVDADLSEFDGWVRQESLQTFSGCNGMGWAERQMDGETQVVLGLHPHDDSPGNIAAENRGGLVGQSIEVGFCGESVKVIGGTGPPGTGEFFPKGLSPAIGDVGRIDSL